MKNGLKVNCAKATSYELSMTLSEVDNGITVGKSKNSSRRFSGVLTITGQARDEKKGTSAPISCYYPGVPLRYRTQKKREKPLTGVI